MSEEKEKIIVKKKPQPRKKNRVVNAGGAFPSGKIYASQNKQNGEITFSRPVTRITGFGKYNASESGVGEKQRAKKKNYKKQLQEAKSDSWWKDTIGAIPDLVKTFAPMLISAISGFGDYDVNSNTLLAGATGGDNGSAIPMMMNTKVANVIRHREFICNVIGSTTEFSIQTFPINPGLDEMFPWLNLVAQGFTSYRILGMIMEFNSLAGNTSTTNYLGYVAMATQYNSLEPVFTDKQAMANSEYGNDKKTSKSFFHPIECAPNQMVLTQLYLRTGSLPASSDIKFYDLGKFSIATGGQSFNGIVGELWCTYEVEFYQPKLAKSGANYINADHWCTTSASITNALPFGADGTRLQLSTTMPGSSLATTTYTFPSVVTSGTYKITYMNVTAAGVTITAPTISLANCSFSTNINLNNTATAFQSIPPNGATSANAFTYIFYVKITGTSAQIIFGTAGTMPAGFLDLYISNIPAVVTEDMIMKKKRGYLDSQNIPISAKVDRVAIENKIINEEFQKQIERMNKRRVLEKLYLKFPNEPKVKIINICDIYDYSYIDVKLILKSNRFQNIELESIGIKITDEEKVAMELRQNEENIREMVEDYTSNPPVDVNQLDYLSKIVIEQTGCSKTLAISVLQSVDLDVVRAIMRITSSRTSPIIRQIY